MPNARYKTTTTGWIQICMCAYGVDDFHDDDRPITQSVPQPVPCTVLDPFHGSGTTGIVALRLGRAYVGVDISKEYLDTVTNERNSKGMQIGIGL